MLLESRCLLKVAHRREDIGRSDHGHDETEIVRYYDYPPRDDLANYTRQNGKFGVGLRRRWRRDRLVRQELRADAAMGRASLGGPQRREGLCN